MKLSELNQSQAGELKHMDVTALLPLGAVEVHGDHLPLGTDLYLAQALTDLVEKKIGEDKALVLPVLPYGQVWSLREAPGSVHIPNDVLSGMIGGLLSGGMEPFQAASLGVYLHGLTADEYVRDRSRSTMLASDILEELPKILP